MDLGGVALPMDYLTWAGIGLVAGVVAKIVHPGKDPGGLIVTLALGVGGALGGGWAARRFGFGDVTGFDLKSLGIATAGSFVLLVLFRFFFGKMKDD